MWEEEADRPLRAKAGQGYNTEKPCLDKARQKQPEQNERCVICPLCLTYFTEFNIPEHSHRGQKGFLLMAE